MVIVKTHIAIGGEFLVGSNYIGACVEQTSRFLLGEKNTDFCTSFYAYLLEIVTHRVHIPL